MDPRVMTYGTGTIDFNKRSKPLKRKKERERLLEEKKKAERELAQQKIREKIGSEINMMFNKVTKKIEKWKRKRKIVTDWEKFINCHRLIPDNVPSINTYTSKYIDDDKLNFEGIDQKMMTLTPFLTRIKALIDFPYHMKCSEVNNRIESFVSLRDRIFKAIDNECFRQIKDLDKYFYGREYPEQEKSFEFNSFNLAVWIRHDLPVKFNMSSNVILASCGVELTFPEKLVSKPTILRVLHYDSLFDVYSLKSKTYNVPFFKKELALICEIKKIYAYKEKKVKDTQEQLLLVKPSIDSLSVFSSLKSSYASSCSDNLSIKSGVSRISTASRRQRPKAAWERDSLHSKAASFQTHYKRFMDNLYRDTSSASNSPSLIFDESGNLRYQDASKKSPISIKTSSSHESLDYLDLVIQREDKHSTDPEVRSVKLLVMSYHQEAKQKSVRLSISELEKTYEEMEETEHMEFLNTLQVPLSTGELNLRAYQIVGPIFQIELFQYIQQKKYLKNDRTLQIVYRPRTLNKEPFFVDYNPERIESEESNRQIESNSKYNEMFSLQIFYQPNYYFNSRPKPVIWDEDENIWSDTYVHDVYWYYDSVIVMKLSKLGVLGLAVNKFHHLPYKSWSISPHTELESHTVLNLECQRIAITFIIGLGKVCVEEILNVPEGFCDHILHKYEEIEEIIVLLRNLGINVFPEDDSFLYIENAVAKPLALEDHIYLAMSLLAKVLEFKHSSWNIAIGRKDIMFQCREAHSDLISFELLKVNIYKAEKLILDDENDFFVSTPDPNLGFVPDIYILFCNMFPEGSGYTDNDLINIYTIYNFLQKTRILIYSGDPNKSI